MHTIQKSSKIAARSKASSPSVKVEHKVQGQDVSIKDTKSSVIIHDLVDLQESEPLVIPMREDLPVDDAPLDMVEDGEYVEELDLEEELVMEVYLSEMQIVKVFEIVTVYEIKSFQLNFDIVNEINTVTEIYAYKDVYFGH